MLRPATAIDPRRLDRTFSLRASDGFVENFGPELISRVAEEAPGVRLRFVQKIDRSSSPLRDGSIDLETGVLGPTKAPELRVQALFQDRFVGVVRSGHPWVRKEMTPALYAGGLHILVSRRGLDRGPIDDALAALGLERRIKTIVGGFAAALALARNSDLVASVPEHHSGTLHRGMYSFPLPVPLHGITVSLFWHPRSGSDPAHAWFRRLVRDVCAGPPGRRGIGSDGASDA